MKKYFSFALLLCLISPFVAKADMLSDGNHNVNTCLFVDNLSMFQNDYTFIISASGHAFPDEFFLKPGNEKDCLHFEGTGTILAVKNSDVSLINQQNPNDTCKPSDPSCEPADWISFPENQKYLFPSHLTFNFDGQLSNESPVYAEHTTIAIDFVGDQKLGMGAHILRHTMMSQTADVIQDATGDPQFWTPLLKQTAPFKDTDSPKLVPPTSTSSTNSTPQPTQTQQQVPTPKKQTFYSQLASPLDTREIIFIILGLVGLGFAVKTWKN